MHGVSMVDLLGAHSRLRGLQGVVDNGTRLEAGTVIRFPAGTHIRVVRTNAQQPDYIADVTLSEELYAVAGSDMDVHASGVGYANDDQVSLMAKGQAMSVVVSDNLALPVLEGTEFYLRPRDVLIAAANTDFLLVTPPAPPPGANVAPPPSAPVVKPEEAQRSSSGCWWCPLILIGAGVVFAGWALTR